MCIQVNHQFNSAVSHGMSYGGHKRSQKNNFLRTISKNWLEITFADIYVLYILYISCGRAANQLTSKKNMTLLVY